jgi:hypothetical protein
MRAGHVNFEPIRTRFNGEFLQAARSFLVVLPIQAANLAISACGNFSTARSISSTVLTF